MSDKSILPVTYCSDRDVQAFIVHDLSHWHPYMSLRPDRVMSAEQLFDAAVARFGERCFDLVITMH